MSVWVADAGPLIFLAKLGRLNLLKEASAEIYVPAGVMSEIHAKSDKASIIIAESSKTWLRTRKAKNRDVVNLLLADMDLGEAEAMRSL